MKQASTTDYMRQEENRVESETRKNNRRKQRRERKIRNARAGGVRNLFGQTIAD